MRFEREINIYGDETVLKRFQAAETSISAVQGKISAMISESELTELENPNSVQQMKQWLADHGLETDTLGKTAVAELIKTAPEPCGKFFRLGSSSPRAA